jgi:hypothetical protein
MLPTDNLARNPAPYASNCGAFSSTELSSLVEGLRVRACTSGSDHHVSKSHLAVIIMSASHIWQ